MFWKTTKCQNEEHVESAAPTLTVALRHGDDGYIVAECIQLPGCMSQGKTEEEAVANIRDAIESCLAVRLQMLLQESCQLPPDLVGIEAQQNFRIKPFELVHA